MKCSECKNLWVHNNGWDEYPPYSTLLVCGVGHWDTCSPEDNLEEERDCPDFIKKETILIKLDLLIKKQ